MTSLPVFPHFKPVELRDRPVIGDVLKAYGVETSELTFTNLFMWHGYAKAQWCLYRDHLLILCRDAADTLYAMQPIGPPPRSNTAAMICNWLREERGVLRPWIERADSRFAAEVSGTKQFTVSPARNHFDYVYLSSDLIGLAGRKFHKKKNHFNKFNRSYHWRYEALDKRHVAACIEMENEWCRNHRCCIDVSLTGEWQAIRTALLSIKDLDFHGGVILIDDTVEAFTLGELLNEQTAVIHIEKANPAREGLYAAINQQFCEHAWRDIPFINREQDLGDEGLRRAKGSYNPHRMVEKFTVAMETA